MLEKRYWSPWTQDLADEDINAAQQEALEQEIAALKDTAERTAEEAKELAGEVPF